MSSYIIAVASDLHAFPPGCPSSSTGSLETPLHGSLDESPLEALVAFVKRVGLRADALLCPGDLGDRAHPASQAYVWEGLNRLQTALQAKNLLATAGNHDLDSRFQVSGFDPFEGLRGLTPEFPLPDAPTSHNDAYWSRHFVVHESSPARIVVLNSSAFHGYRSEGTDPEHDHGRVSAQTINWLVQSLDDQGRRDVNVLLCHHHLQRFGVDDLDVSEMRGAQPLLDVLESAGHGPWLVIHGHRHYPWLAYANGGASAPSIFSAGSVSGATWKLPVNNQFYLIAIDVASAADLHSVTGTFRAWDWSPSGKWISAGETSGLPARGGFGLREGILASANRAFSILKKSEAPFMTWDEVAEADPALRFLLPRDEAHTIDYLHAHLGVSIEVDTDREQTQLAIGGSS